METRAAAHLDRLDRHISRSYVRMSAGVSRFRATGALEEAVRLAELPGEREGRHYYFRRVSFGEIPAQANRRLWMDRVQQTLGELAATAIHGSDPRAAASNAVFFDNVEQAFEALLRRSLRSGTSRAWYDAAVLGEAPDPDNALAVFHIVRRLRQSLPPVVGAAIIFASVSHSNPAALLNALPISWIRDWLREMESDRGAPDQISPMAFPGSWTDTLRLAAQEFGWKEPRTIWLAALGVMTYAPTPLVSSAAVRRARATLQWMAQEQAREPLDRGAAIIRGKDAQLLRFRSDVEEARAARATARAALPDAEHEPGKPGSAAAAAAPHDMPPARQVAAAAILGEATAAAGLYFLLHALRQLGMADALAASPVLADAGFAAHILKRLAAHAKVADHDPIHHFLDLETGDLSGAGAFTDARVWPRNWPATASRHGDGRSLLRIWSLAVRRWCRRNAGVTVRDIVTRDGQVWLTRTDLDITLPLTALDVRIRRIGLDIDPGWVPWLSRLGRVVRFHYRDRGPPEASS